MADFITALYNPVMPKIQIGQEYRIRKYRGEMPYVDTMRCVGIYTHHAMLQNEKGIRECYGWWELQRIVL